MPFSLLLKVCRYVVTVELQAGLHVWQQIDQTEHFAIVVDGEVCREGRVEGAGTLLTMSHTCLTPVTALIMRAKDWAMIQQEHAIYERADRMQFLQ